MIYNKIFYKKWITMLLFILLIYDYYNESSWWYGLYRKVPPIILESIFFYSEKTR